MSFKDFYDQYKKQFEVHLRISDENLVRLEQDLQGDCELMERIHNSCYNFGWKYFIGYGERTQEDFNQWLYSGEFWDKMETSFYDLTNKVKSDRKFWLRNYVNNFENEKFDMKNELPSYYTDSNGLLKRNPFFIELVRRITEEYILN